MFASYLPGLPMVKVTCSLSPATGVTLLTVTSPAQQQRMCLVYPLSVREGRWHSIRELAHNVSKAHEAQGASAPSSRRNIRKSSTWCADRCSSAGWEGSLVNIDQSSPNIGCDVHSHPVVPNGHAAQCHLLIGAGVQNNDQHVVCRSL